MRTTLMSAILLACNLLGLYGQLPTVPPSPAFEVASIKAAHNSGIVPVCFVPCTGERLTVNGTRIDIRFMSLYQLIVRAYRIKLYQLSGPDWMASQKFDIVAKMPDGASKDQIPEMLQTLLAERFRLSIHRERKEHPVYALVTGKNGSKLKTSTANAAASIPEVPAEQTLYTPYGEAHMGKDGVWQIREGPYGPIRIYRDPSAITRVEFLKITMPGLAEALTPSVDRVVADTTGLQGDYQMQIDWSVPPPPPSSAASGLAVPAPPPSVSFQSIESSGLKLERRTAPVDVIIVDSLQKTATSN